MDLTNVTLVLNSFQIEINNRINDINQLTHSHPPTHNYVPTCLYCRKFGNVFSNSQMVPNHKSVFNHVKTFIEQK